MSELVLNKIIDGCMVGLLYSETENIIAYIPMGSDINKVANGLDQVMLINSDIKLLADFLKIEPSKVNTGIAVGPNQPNDVMNTRVCFIRRYYWVDGFLPEDVPTEAYRIPIEYTVEKWVNDWGGGKMVVQQLHRKNTVI